jgi:hypothetical protein
MIAILLMFAIVIYAWNLERIPSTDFQLDDIDLVVVYGGSQYVTRHDVYVSIWSEPFKPRELCVHDPRTNVTVKKTLPYSWVNAEVIRPYFRKAMQEIGKAREMGR